MRFDSIWLDEIELEPDNTFFCLFVCVMSSLRYLVLAVQSVVETIASVCDQDSAILSHFFTHLMPNVNGWAKLRQALPSHVRQPMRSTVLYLCWFWHKAPVSSEVGQDTFAGEPLQRSLRDGHVETENGQSPTSAFMHMCPAGKGVSCCLTFKL